MAQIWAAQSMERWKNIQLVSSALKKGINLKTTNHNIDDSMEHFQC